MSRYEKYLPFEKAREYVRRQRLKNTKEWKKWSNGTLEGKERRPEFIPSNPDVIYKNNGWISWTDWINEPIKFLPFEKAREFVRSLGLKSQSAWQRYYQGKIDRIQKPENIPWNPQKIYADKWNGIKDWLGTDWIDFNEAREFVRSLGLSGQIEWKLYCKNELDGYDTKPINIPSDPKRIYEGSGWIDMSDWLGTERKRRTNNGDVNDTWLSYEDAREYVHSLKLTSFSEWKKYITEGIESLPSRPVNLPKSPQFVYKNEGWSNWSDWLGNNIDDISNEKYIVKDEVSNLDIQEYKKVASFTLEYLIKEYEDNIIITKILSFFNNDTSFKSIIELDLKEYEISEIKRFFLDFRGKPNKFTYEKKAFIGLLFLIYVAYDVKSKISYSVIWKEIIKRIATIF